MASTYSTLLGLELMATGENSGTWGTKTNNNLSPLLETAVCGRATANFTSDANFTITIDDGVSSTGRYFIINATSAGSLTATRDLICPLRAGKTYVVFNNTSGSQSIRVIGSSGTGITIPNGKTGIVYTDGTNYKQLFDYVTGAQLENSPIGATTASTGAFTTLTTSSTVTTTSSSAAALTVGRQGVTNPVLNVDASTATVVTGLNIKGAAAAAGVALSVTSSGTNENLTIDAKGSGTITFNATGTGNVLVNRLLDISAATAGQIKFPATANASADANTLDDYEEGTWTMGVSFGGAVVGITYGTRDASYVKIGRTVSIVGGMSLTNKGSSTGVARVTGLPFTTNTGTQQQYSSNNIAGMPGVTITGTLAFGTYFTGSATTLDVIQIDTTGVLGTVADTAFSNTASIYGSLTFISTT